MKANSPKTKGQIIEELSILRKRVAEWGEKKTFLDFGPGVSKITFQQIALVR